MENYNKGRSIIKLIILKDPPSCREETGLSRLEERKQGDRSVGELQARRPGADERAGLGAAGAWL